MRTRIQRSIGAIITLFLMGFLVLGASFTIFESNVRSEPIPQSMSGQSKPPRNTDMLTVFLMAVAAAGLPLGAYVVSTLAALDKKAEGQ